MNKHISNFIIFTILLLFSLNIYSQEKRSEALKIYLDGDFDPSYIKENFTVVNYVRDRLHADVHIQLTTMRTASGGRKFTMELMGQNQFHTMQDTLIFFLESSYSDDEKRELILKKLKLGLVPYLLRTPFAALLDLSIANKKNEVSNDEDKWNHWVFNIHAGGYSNGVKTYNSIRGWSGFSVSKVTEEMKIETSINANFNRDVYRAYDGDKLVLSDTSQNYGYGFYGLLTKSIGEHWGAGGYLRVSQSSYRNIKLQMTLIPAIEYNVFKYSEASKKQLRFLYSIGPKWNTYFDTTVYLKMEELVFEHQLKAYFKQITKWGDINLSGYYSNYFHDFNLLDFGFDIGARFRIVKGLSMSINGNVNFPRDQITLKKGIASSVDLYTRQRELQTNYSYYIYLSLSYTFGSIYNNVVNPRFDENY